MMLSVCQETYDEIEGDSPGGTVDPPMDNVLAIIRSAGENACSILCKIFVSEPLTEIDYTVEIL